MPTPESIRGDLGIRGAGKRSRAPVDPVQLEVGTELVQHRQCDAAVGRQLPARDRDHPERAGGEHRLAVRPGSRDRPGGENADSGEARAHRAEGVHVHGERGLFQDLPFLRFGRLDRASVALEGGVRGPDEDAARPGDGKGDACPVDRICDRCAPAAVALEHEVRSPAQGHRGARARVLEASHIVDPGPGGVHDRARSDARSSPRTTCRAGGRRVLAGAPGARRG